MAGAAPALAAPEGAGQPAALESLHSAFKAICLDHLNDPDAQLAAAKSAPFEAEELPTREDGTIRLHSGGMVIIVRDQPKLIYCGVGGPIDGALDLEAGQALLEPTAGAPSKQDGTRLFWENGKVHFAFIGNTAADGQAFVLFASGLDRD
ncbi:hypothetical protein [Novosphingobium sp.]|uniref:hypothetical protein n=1 Tax=Novosphingobium sp. TaxID=1874826 RepID=UPI00370449E2